MNYNELCTRIVEIDPNIRFCAAYHVSSERLAGGYTKKPSFILDDATAQAAISRAILIRNTHKMMEEYFGKELYTFMEYEKAKGFIFPMKDEDVLLFVTMESEGDHLGLLAKIRSLLQKQ